MSASDLAPRLLDELCAPLGAPNLRIDVGEADEPELWAASGARALTGAEDGPPLDAPGAPASATQAALTVAETYLGVALPGVEVLGERAALSGLGRNAPFSPGGAFRCLPARDGWLGLSIARDWDRDVLPALIGAPVSGDPWVAVARWLRATHLQSALERAITLDLAAAAVPDEAVHERRPPVTVVAGGVRSAPSRPTVVDLSALWAGPLCARILALGGARVVKVESVDRPDGARLGPEKFFDLMHAGAEFVQLDFARQRDELRALLVSADVVIEASRPRALAHLGIDAHQFVAAGTVWAAVSAYGRGDADANRVGFGDDVAAGAGLVARTPSGPVPVGDALADPMSGVHAAAAVAVALRGDRGCLLDVSMHDVCRRAAAVRSD